MADVGVWMAPSVLEHKLEDGDCPGHTETTWNCARLPKRLSEEKPPHRLFVASGGVWRGYFRLLPDVLWNPEDEKAPYALIFDGASWVEIRPVPVRRFRGFTYDVPAVPPPEPRTARDRVRATRDRILAARNGGPDAKKSAPADEGGPAAKRGGRAVSESDAAGVDREPGGSKGENAGLPRSAAGER